MQYHFQVVYFLLQLQCLQHIVLINIHYFVYGEEKHQLMIKYDWYDPNTDVEKLDIGKTGTNLTQADIKYSTVGIGYSYYINPQILKSSIAIIV